MLKILIFSLFLYKIDFLETFNPLKTTYVGSTHIYIYISIYTHVFVNATTSK